MELPIDAATLDRMKYADLQKLAKKIGVKANMKADKLTLQPAVGETVETRQESRRPRQPQGSARRKDAKDGKGRKPTKDTESDEQISASEMVIVPAEQAATPIQIGQRPTGGSTAHAQSRGGTSSTPKPSNKTPVVMPTKRRTRTISATRTPNVATPVVKTTKHRTHSKSPASKPVARTTKRRTHTISPVKLQKVKTPVAVTTKVTTPIRKGSAPRAKVQHAAVTPSGSVKTNKVKRKRPASGSRDSETSKSKRAKRDQTVVEHAGVSPGVKEVLDTLTDGLTDAQLRQSIKQAVDKRVQEKSADVSLSKTVTVAGTNIPRFTALARGFSVTKPVITPGHKDWARIHQRAFEKMDSIDVYLKKRHNRAQSASAKKVQEMTQRMQTALNSLKKIETTPRALANKGARVVKPVVGGGKAKSLFQSPAVAFVPKVTSVSKMNLQFASSMTSKPKTPRPAPLDSTKENFLSPKTTNATFDAKRKSGVVNTKRKSGLTPFVFRGNLNQSATAPKKFDLQESLARKTTWKPHRGKLQPFVGPDPYRAPIKEVKVQSRDQRRTTAQKRRANKRLDSQLSRRGITITG
ncbi:hypothetical protein LSAT2_000989 [Lamellibrachia satsuma]|nr:hypothetical protein LSAT2_000989 [Lamellibrachia satsuma]